MPPIIFYITARSHINTPPPAFKFFLAAPPPSKPAKLPICPKTYLQFFEYDRRLKL